eukprot:g23129.t1
MGGGIGGIEEVGWLPKDLDSLGELAKKWQMEYNVRMCEVMQFGRKNRGIDYCLNGEKIQKFEVQRDLEVLVQDSLNINLQV